MQLKLNIKYNIRWPSALLKKRSQYMVDTTGKEIVRGIRRNIMESISIAGSHFRKIKPDTRRRKKGLRYPNKALYALGILYRAIHYYKTGENAGAVGIIRRGLPSRRNVAEWQQRGTYQGGVARRFFGISSELRRGRLIPMWNDWLRAITRRTETIKSGKI